MNEAFINMLYFVIYTVFILWLGKRGFNKTKNAKDFYVAGGKLGLFTSVSTFGGTWFSAVSMLGLTGSVYVFGYSAILYSVIGWFLGAFLIVLLASKLKDYPIKTVPEFFSVKYNSKYMQIAAGLIIAVSYIFYIYIQIRGFGIVMGSFLDIPYTLGIFLIYLYIVYTTFGGLISVARTDIVNFLLITFGLVLSGILLLNMQESITEMNLQVSKINSEVFKGSNFFTEKGSLVDPFNNGLQPPLLLISSFFAWGLGLAANPQYAIRIISAKNKKTATNMVGITVLIMIIVYTSVVFIGLGARVLIPTAEGLNSIDEIFPYIIDNLIPAKFSGFILVSMIAAAVSTSNSQLLIFSSSVCYDIYKNLTHKKMNREKFLNLNRIVVVLGGSFSLFFALQPPESTLIYGSKIWAIIASAFLIPLYGGIFWEKATSEGAIASFSGGLITCLLFFIFKIGYQRITPITSDFIINPVLPSLAVSLLLFVIVSLKTKKNNLKEESK
ncbi:MAG: sodium:solute symporter family protein [Bacillota bacterium]